jgi:cell division septal protein FtsQ
LAVRSLRGANADHYLLTASLRSWITRMTDNRVTKIGSKYYTDRLKRPEVNKC